MMEYLKLYPDRLTKCSEIIEDAIQTGDDGQISEAFELVGRLFYAAMQYAFTDVEPDFPRRSIEGAEWRDWRSDVDRGEAKMAAMRELGAKGGNAKAAASASGKKQTAEKNVATVKKNVATLEENVATLEKDVAALDENVAAPEKEARKSSANIKTQVKPNVKTHVNPQIKTQVQAQSEAYAQVEAKTEVEGETYPHAQSEGQEQAQLHPQDQEQAKLQIQFKPDPQPDSLRPMLRSAPPLQSTSELFNRLCADFPDISAPGFRDHVKDDIRAYGYDKIHAILLKAYQANTKERVSYVFYKSIRDRMIEEDDGIERATREHLERMAQRQSKLAGGNES